MKISPLLDWFLDCYSFLNIFVSHPVGYITEFYPDLMTLSLHNACMLFKSKYLEGTHMFVRIDILIFLALSIIPAIINAAKRMNSRNMPHNMVCGLFHIG